MKWLKGVKLKNYGTESIRMVVVAPKIMALEVFSARDV